MEWIPFSGSLPRKEKPGSSGDQKDPPFWGPSEAIRPSRLRKLEHGKPHSPTRAEASNAPKPPIQAKPPTKGELSNHSVVLREPENHAGSPLASLHTTWTPVVFEKLASRHCSRCEWSASSNSLALSSWSNLSIKRTVWWTFEWGFMCGHQSLLRFLMKIHTHPGLPCF